MKLDAVVCGAAGQGVLTLSKVLTKAALSEGFEAKCVAWFGIAKTEGPVWAHVRLGTPVGPSPKIRRKSAGAMVALDRLEAMKHAHYLARGALVLLDETGMPPVYSSCGDKGYPSPEDAAEVFSGMELNLIPAQEIAAAVGSIKLCGAVMLGALCALRPLVDRDQLVLALREEEPQQADLEAEAFFAGYSFITGKEV